MKKNIIKSRILLFFILILLLLSVLPPFILEPIQAGTLAKKFGNTSLTEDNSDSGHEDYIISGLFKMPTETVSATAQSIVLKDYYTGASSRKMRCMIYDNSANYVGKTDEKTVSGGSGTTTLYFDFSVKPTLTSATNYYLCFWSNSGAGTQAFIYNDVSGNGVFTQSKTYWTNGSAPIHITWTTFDADGNFSIYCNYTVTTTADVAPSVSCSPNATKNTTLTPKLNATCTDSDGDHMNASWWANTYQDTHVLSENCSTWNTALWDPAYAGAPTVAHGYWYFNVSAGENHQYQAQTKINHSYGLYTIRFKTANSSGGTGRVPGVDYAFWLYGLHYDEVDMFEIWGENIPELGSIANEVTISSYNWNGGVLKHNNEWYSNSFNWEDGNWHTFSFLYTPEYFVILFDGNYSYAMMNNYRWEYSALSGPTANVSYIPTQPMKLMIDVNGKGTQTRGFSFIVDQIDYYSGNMHNVGSNSSFLNGTKRQTYSGFNARSSMYVWGVNVSDGRGGYTNKTNWFTTKWNAPLPWSNRAPVFSNPSPVNASTWNPLYCKTNITVSDADGNATTVCFWNNKTGSWVKAQQNNSVAANTTVRDVNASYVTTIGTTYWWKVTAYDGHTNTSAIYHFTTVLVASAVFVSTTGSDSYTGSTAGDISHPFKTLHKALAKATTSSTIYMRGGTYTDLGTTTQYLIVNHSGTTGYPFTIRNYTGETVTIDASGYSVPTSPGGFFNFFSGTNYYHDILIYGITFENVNGASTPYECMLLGASTSQANDNITISHCSFNVINDRVVDADSDNTPTSKYIHYFNFNNCTFVHVQSSSTMDECFDVRGCMNFNFENNTIIWFTKQFLHISGGVKYAYIHHNSFRNINYFTMKFDASYDPTNRVTDHIYVYNNLFWGNSGTSVTDIIWNPETASGGGTSNVNNVSIYNNIFNESTTSSEHSAMKFYPSRSGCTLDNLIIKENTFYCAAGASSKCLSIYPNGYSVTFRNLKSYNNIYMNSPTCTNQVYCNFPKGSSYWSTGYNDYYKTSGTTLGVYYSDDSSDIEATSFIADPKVVSSGSNFYLQGGSPCNNTGTATYGVPVDYQGTTRPQGTGYDIGAYEYIVGGSIPPTPSPASNISFYLGSDVYLKTGYTNYSTKTTMAFSSIKIDDTFVQFNSTYFRTTSTPSTTKINVTINSLEDSISNMTDPAVLLVNFTGKATSGTATWTIGGFTPSTTYNTYKDGVLIGTVSSDSGGNLTITNNVWTTHYFTVYYSGVGIAPTVTTNSATGITSSNATLQGYLNDDGGSASTVNFVYGTVLGGPYPSSTATQSKTTGQYFSINLGSLSIGTTYYYKAKAVTGGLTAYGLEKSFTTSSTYPIVTTYDATTIGTGTATLNGYLNYDGGGSCNVNFQYGTTTSYGIETSLQTGIPTGYAFGSSLSSLTPGTTYHYRAKANTSGLVAYGADKSFTIPDYPTITTDISSGIGTTNVTLWGYLNLRGLTSKCNCTIQYGLTTSYGTTTSNSLIIADGVYYSKSITSLLPGVLYHYRAVAYNGYYTTVGLDATFTTLPSGNVTITNPRMIHANWTTTTSVNLTWIPGSGTGTKIIRKTGSYPTSIIDGTSIYTGSHTYYNDTGLTSTIRYFYRFYSYNGTSYSTGVNAVFSETDNTTIIGSSWINFKGYLTTDRTTQERFQYSTNQGFTSTLTNITALETSQTTSDTTLSIYGDYTEGQTFLGGAYYLNSITIKAIRYGSPGTLYCYLYATGTNWLPTGPILSYGSTNANTFSVSPSWNNITMSPYLLSAGTRYAFVLNVSTASSYNYVSQYAHTPDSYPTGQSFRGSPAYVNKTDDLAFKIWGNTKTTIGSYLSTSNTTSFSSGTFTINQTSLNPGTLYYYRAAGNDTNGNMTKGNNRYTLTRPGQPIYLNFIPYYSNSSAYISWIPGTNSNRTLVVKGSTGYPTVPSMGNITFNGTTTYTWIHGLVFNATYYFSLFGFTSMSGLSQFSLYTTAGSTMVWGGAQIIVYNESKPWQPIGFNLLVTNSNLDTYEIKNIVGPYFVNVTSIPYGSNTLFTISNTSYRTRNSYLDIYPNTFYYLIFYLPPIKLNGSTVEENATALYNVRVIETIYTGYSLSDIPVQNAKVTFKRYFNNTLIYSNISTLLTDANGYVNIYLEPSVGYYATIDDTGYNTSTAFFTAFPPDQYGNTLEKTFRVYRQTSTGGIIDYTSMFKNIDFSLEPPGTRHSSGFILYYNISSSDSQLEWYRMNVYYKPDGSSTWTLLFTDNETNPSGGSISYTVANNTGEYSVECWFKKTGYNAIEIYNKGNMAYFIVKLNQWVASIPDDAYFIVMIILMMIGMGFCMLYFGTGVITGYVGLGIMAFMLSLHDITVDTGVGGLGTEIMLNGWVIFGITFLIYTALIFLWSRI